MNDKKKKAIEELNKRLLGENFDPDRYQETEDNGYNNLIDYLNTLNLTDDEKTNIMGLATSYADDMWREGARGGFADR
jgi:hypothetical protein